MDALIATAEPIRVLPSITLNREQLKAMGVTILPRAGAEVLLSGVARVVHASTSDHDRDGKLDSAHVVLEFEPAELELEEIPEEPRPVSRGDAGKKLYGSRGPAKESRKS